jgi:nucleoside-diphosphate-sugar epimerase
VVGLARNDASRSMLTAMHATSYSGQGYDVERLAEAMVTMHAIVHLATGMPSNDAPIEDDWTHSGKLVASLLRHLLEASELSGVRTVIFPSIHAVYGDHGDAWVDEEVTIYPDSSSEWYIEAERLLMDSTTLRRSAGVVLRMGLTYSADAPHTRGLLYALKIGQAPIGTGGHTYWPPLHVEDAVQAIVLALEHSPAGQIFNVCDDEPVQKENLYRELARWVGGPPPLAKGRTGNLMPYQGRVSASALQWSVRMSNRKAKERLGFAPRYRTYRDGYPPIIEEWRRRTAGG